MTTTKTVHNGRPTNRGVAIFQKQLSDWIAANAARVVALRPDFQAWFQNEVSHLRTNIDAKHPVITIQANVRHLVTTLKRMEDGEIVAVTIRPNGCGFELR